MGEQEKKCVRLIRQRRAKRAERPGKRRLAKMAAASRMPRGVWSHWGK
jgi:hypothetical protein